MSDQDTRVEDDDEERRDRRHTDYLITTLHRVLKLVVAGAICFIVAMAIIYLAFQERIDEINAERADRIDTSAGLAQYNCDTNNSQDTLLAQLIEASLASNTQFGEGIDTTQLTEFDYEVVNSINKIQKLTAMAQPSSFKKVFKQKLAELKNLAPCEEYVAHYRAGDTIDFPPEVGTDGTGIQKDDPGGRDSPSSSNRGAVHTPEQGTK